MPAGTPWAHVTMILELSELPASDPRDYLALQGRILRAVRRWLRAKGQPACYLWVRELGPRYSMAHTHALVPLLPELRGELAELIYRVGRLRDAPNARAVKITPETARWSKTGEPDNRGLHTHAQRVGVLRDFLKTISPKARDNGEQVMPALGVDNRGQKPCTILGKRSGTSEDIAAAARRRAGWRELVTLRDLRSALPTGAEAREQRDRQRSRAKRHNRMLRTAGVRPPAPPKPPPRPVQRMPKPDPCDTSDLASDFLDA
jgi:hypothetical protein